MSALLASELRSVALVTGLLALVFAVFELWRRLGAQDPEWSRKGVHVGNGMLVCSFPWLFKSAWTVTALAGAFVALLWVARRGRWLASVGSVSRWSIGELLFPVAVAVLFWVSAARPELYLAAVLVLVLPDAAAALVGQRYGLLRYEVDQGESKSFEGSLAFFLLTYLAVLLPLLLMTELDKRLLVLAALQTAFLVACLEAICVKGMDNLVVPIGAWYILVQLTAHDADWMLAHLGVQAALLAISGLLAWRGRLLSLSGFLAAQLYLYGAYAYGDWHWLPAPLAAYAALALWKGRKPLHQFKAVGFFWAISAPLALLVLNNYLAVFAPASRAAGLQAWLPALFAGAHAAGAAMAWQSYGKPRAWAAPCMGLAGALLLGALAQAGGGEWHARSLLAAAILGLTAPLLQNALWRNRAVEPAQGARRLALLLFALLGTALAWAWSRLP